MDPFTIAAMVLFAVSFIYSVFLAPRPKVQNAVAGTLQGVNAPQATSAAPVPLVLGMVRLKGPNTIWYGDFSTIKLTQTVKSGGFFGIGGSSKKQIIGYQYYVGMDLALCLGPDVVLHTIWAGKYVVYRSPLSHLEVPDPTKTPFTQGQAAQYGAALTGTDSVFINLLNLFGGSANGGGGGLQGYVQFYDGNYTQIRDTYLATKVDANVPGYSGVSHIVLHRTGVIETWTGGGIFGGGSPVATTHTGFYIGTTTSLNNFEFEISRHTNSLGLSSGHNVMPNGFDLNPMEAVYFILTDEWAGCGLPSSYIDVTTFREAGETLYAEGFGVSVVVDTKNTARDVINLIMQQINGLLRIDQSTGKITVKLLRQDYDVTTLPVLNQSNVLEVKQFAITMWSETFNHMRVTFPDRGNGYQNSVAVAQNGANMNMQGRVLASDISMPMCYVPDTAMVIAARELSMMDVPLYKAQITVNREGASILPGDAFIFEWPEWGIIRLVCRVLKSDLGTLADGHVTLDITQDVFSDSTVLLAAPGLTSWEPVLRSPLEIDDRLVLEAPWFLQGWAGLAPVDGDGRIMTFEAEPSAFSQSYWAFTSVNGFLDALTEVESAVYPGTAVLVDAISATPTDPLTMYDTVTGVKVQDLAGTMRLIELQETLSDTELREGGHMFMVGDELFSFEGVNDNGDDTYTFTNVRRALLDTCPIAHAAGDRLYVVQDTNCILPSNFDAGTEVEVRVTDQTDFGLFAYEDQPSDTLTLDSRSDRPLRPRLLAADGVAAPAPGATTVTLTWRATHRTHEGLVWEDDATEAPETGQSYVVRASENGGAFTEFTVGAGVLTYVYTYVDVGTYVSFEVYSVLGSLRSWTPARLSFTFLATLSAGDAVATRTDESLVITRAGDIVNYT